MKRPVIVLLVLFAGAVGAGWLAWQRTHAGPRLPVVDHARAEARLHKDVLPVLNQYCWDCHADGTSKGGVSFDSFTNVSGVLADRKTWERVLATLRDGSMPPMKKRQPTVDQRELVGHWIEDTLFPVDPDNPDPGRVTIRRLNRTEYNNTIRDLVGVDFRPADDFPQDDVGYGFDNIGDVLSLPPVLLEKYLRAANKILSEAIVTGPPEPVVRRFGPREIQGDQGGDAIATLASNGEMWVEFEVKIPGDYVLMANAYGDQAGDENVKMAFRLDSQELPVIEVKARKSRPETYEIRRRIEAGRHRFKVAFLNDFYQEGKDKDGKVNRDKTKDRNLQVLHLAVTGPYTDQVPPLPESHRRLFATKGGLTNDVARAREIVGRFASRAYRRPATPSETERLVGLFNESVAHGDNFEQAIKAACTAVLVSPHFLFRGELQPDPDNPRSVHPVDEYALASRLSYFLWSTMPDETLSQLAAQGRLRKNLDAQVRRMLKDPRSEALVDNFVAQWLNLRLLDVAAPDAEKFPGFDADLRRAMREETRRFITYILREDRNVLEFLSADYTFANEKLARHYGLSGVTGDEFVKVSLKGTPRGGLLTHGSILTLTSNPTRTSPVKRGKYVLENLLGTPPPPAPPNVPSIEDQGKKLTGTLRQKMEQHRENPLCASCHLRMDSIGFAFENFDGVGAWRDKDGPDAIDPAGVLVTGEKFAGPGELKTLLLTQRRQDFLRCIAEKMLIYALGRGAEYYDRPAIDAVVKRLSQKDFKFSELILGVVQSVPFQQRRGEGDPTQPIASTP